MNVLTLAFMGDAIWTMLVRQYVVAQNDLKIGALNKKANELVCAKAQALIFDKIKPFLTQKEIEIANRARNTKKNTVAKNATIAEYAKSTSLEAVIGYNYLTGNMKRIQEIWRKSK